MLNISYSLQCVFHLKKQKKKQINLAFVVCQQDKANKAYCESTITKIDQLEICINE